MEKIFTKEDIKHQLAAMGAPKGRVVIVHTALRLVGKIEGGGEALLDALIEYFTEDGGLLCIPTHTWANLDTDKITLDMLTPESNLGAIPTLAAQDGRGVRSENPTHSMVVFGERERALRFVGDEVKVTTPTAPDGCYGKIYDEDGYVLLLGVAQDKNTYLHCVAEKLEIPNRMSDKFIKTTIRRTTGEIVERKIRLFDTDYTADISWHFGKYDTAFRYRGCTTQGLIGNAPTQLCHARGLLETVKLIFERSGGIDPLASEKPIPPKWYC
jgi:aminoglycoside 3-N-acetyltransferase